VAGYIDLLLQYGSAAFREGWRAGLAAVESAAKSEFGRSLVDCSAEQQARLIERMAAGENHPESELEKFFVLFKATAVQGFSLSEAGRRTLGYRGDGAIHHFAGCTHPEHHRR
jgi:hypothetical protein